MVVGGSSRSLSLSIALAGKERRLWGWLSSGAILLLWWI